MTPYEINVLLHYYAKAEEMYKHTSYEPPVFMPTIDRFIADGLLEVVPERPLERPNDKRWQATQKGRAMVRALCSVPLPKPSFICEIPGGDLLGRECAQPTYFRVQIDSGDTPLIVGD